MRRGSYTILSAGARLNSTFDPCHGVRHEIFGETNGERPGRRILVIQEQGKGNRKIEKFKDSERRRGPQGHLQKKQWIARAWRAERATRGTVHLPRVKYPVGVRAEDWSDFATGG